VKRPLLENLGWKVLSLAIAVALWMTLVGEQELTTSVSAPVVFRSLPQDLEISSDVPDRIHLEIQGSVGRLSHLATPAVTLDLKSVDRPGERTFPIRQENVSLPPGVILSRAVPGGVRLRFERRMDREVPVRVRFTGPPQSGLHVVSQAATPSTVKITGPESHVRRVEFAETDPIDLSATAGQSEFQVHAFVGDPLVRVGESLVVLVRVRLEKTP